MDFKTVYDIDPWIIKEDKYDPNQEAQGESIFSVGNGYLGLRGNFEEGDPAFVKGTYINGFYEFRPIIYGESAYGFAKNSQTMINITDCKIIKLFVDDEAFNVSTSNILKYQRYLDMRKGTLEREVLWKTTTGKEVSVKSSRLVSYKRRHLAAIQYEVEVNETAKVVISSEMISNESNQLNEWDPRAEAQLHGQVLFPQEYHSDREQIYSSHTTKNSKMTLGCLMDHQIFTENPYEVNHSVTDNLGKVIYTMTAHPNRKINLTKFMVYDYTKEDINLYKSCQNEIKNALKYGFDLLLEEQQNFLDLFWDSCDVVIEGNGAAQQGIRFSLFSIIQAVGKNGERSIGAKGLTGQGYEGHYFWDSEIYVHPFLTYTVPMIAKNLLRYRYSKLDLARERAKTMSQRGALFPWRTINGEEASAYFPAGTAQYHINADIMHALKKYVDVTGDEKILEEFGAEMLTETARFWVDIGCYVESKGGKFCIHDVTGPDEYTAIVNNNFYTNIMARENLSYAAKVVAKYNPLGVSKDEIEGWQKAADNMDIPFDKKLGIYSQDDSFLQKKAWDFKNTPQENYPLLLHYHPLVIYRHQVIKQSDLILGMFLLGKYFTHDEIKRNFDYYDPLTTGDSSLSDCIQGIIATEIGYHDKVYHYFMETVEMDLDNINKNVRDGVHIASMAGSWIYTVYGFAGMRDYDGNISFNPKMPKELTKIQFKLKIRGQVLQVELKQDATTYTLLEGTQLTFKHKQEEINITVGNSTTRT